TRATRAPGTTRSSGSRGRSGTSGGRTSPSRSARATASTAWRASPPARRRRSRSRRARRGQPAHRVSPSRSGGGFTEDEVAGPAGGNRLAEADAYTRTLMACQSPLTMYVRKGESRIRPLRYARTEFFPGGPFPHLPKSGKRLAETTTLPLRVKRTRWERYLG